MIFLSQVDSLTMLQNGEHEGFPKAAVPIEISEGGHQHEASDRELYSQLLQMTHRSGRLTF